MRGDADLRLTELLCSHLCHELISPVTAVNNGLELVGEDTGTLSEVLDLMRGSAAEASNRLQFYRLAYGRAVGLEDQVDLRRIRGLAQGLLEGGKITLDWPLAEPGSAPALGKEGARLLLNMIALALEALPRGGTLAVRVSEDADGLPVRLTARGPNAGFKDDVQAALSPAAEIDSLDPRTVHGFFTVEMARRLQAGFEIARPDAETLRLSARLPGVPR